MGPAKPMARAVQKPTGLPALQLNGQGSGSRAYYGSVLRSASCAATISRAVRRKGDNGENLVELAGAPGSTP